MKKKRSILLIILLSMCFSFFVFAETVVLKSGKKIEGKIIEKTDEYIKIDLYGMPITYYFEDIESTNGGGVSALNETSSASSRMESSVSSSSISFEKTPAQIFKEAAPAIVVISCQSATDQMFGSGFLVDAEGVIVTNFHVIEGAEKIEVKLKDGHVFPVTGIIDYDSFIDIAVLKIDAHNLPILSLGDSDTLESGEKILVIGAPLGLEYTISDGLYSGLRRSNDSTGARSLQISAPVSEGSSGGPVLNMHGRVMGIANWVKDGGQNLNFAVPINEAKGLIRKQPKISMREFSTKVSKAYEFLHRAIAAAELHNYDETIRYLEAALELKPDMVKAYIGLAQLYNLTEKSEKVISILEKAATYPMSNRQKSSIYSEQGNAYMVLGETEKAIQLWNKSIELDEDNESAISAIATLLFITNKYEEAISNYKRCLEIRPTGAYYNNQLGKIYASLHKPQEAKMYFLKAKELIESGDCDDTDGGKSLLPEINDILNQLSSLY